MTRPISADENEIVRVKIPADLSCTGQTRWKDAKIDSCIAPIVHALQSAGIDMRGSCCGHGKSNGYIELADGRFLMLFPDYESAETYLAAL